MQRIDTNLCGKCGYDLTGLAITGRCPECGQAFDRMRKLGVKRLETDEDRLFLWLRRLRTLALALLTFLALGFTILLWAIGKPRTFSGLFLTVFLGFATLLSFAHHRDEENDQEYH